MTDVVDISAIIAKPLHELTRKDIRSLAKRLSQNEARVLISRYYQEQRRRVVSGNQDKAIERATGTGSVFISFLSNQSSEAESFIKTLMDDYSMDHPVGRWLRAHHGIGPVVAGGILACVDIKRAPAPGHILSLGGFSPTSVWNKGELRPWNATFKQILYHLGESFKKFHKNPKCYYGHLWAARKELLEAENAALKFADRAKADMAKYDKGTEAYKWCEKGMLPPGHLDARARRWVVKIFINHLHAFWYEQEFGIKPPRPYPFEHLGHVHEIKNPFYDDENGIDAEEMTAVVEEEIRRMKVAVAKHLQDKEAEHRLRDATDAKAKRNEALKATKEKKASK